MFFFSSAQVFLLRSTYLSFLSFFLSFVWSFSSIRVSHLPIFPMSHVGGDYDNSNGGRCSRWKFTLSGKVLITNPPIILVTPKLLLTMRLVFLLTTSLLMLPWLALMPGRSSHLCLCQVKTCHSSCGPPYFQSYI